MRFAIVVAFVAVGIAIGAAFALGGGPRNAYVVSALVADRQQHAPHVDVRLVNAWGLAASPTGPWWTSNEASATSTLYTGRGRRQLLTVQVAGGPTGVVWHAGNGIPGCRRSSLRLGALHLRLRGRQAARVGSVSAEGVVDRGGGGRRRRRERRGLPWSRDRRLSPLCDRLPQRTCRRVRRALAARTRSRAPSSTGRFRSGTRRSAFRRSVITSSSPISGGRRSTAMTRRPEVTSTSSTGPASCLRASRAAGS